MKCQGQEHCSGAGGVAFARMRCVYPIADLESIWAEAAMKPASTDDDGPNEHAEDHVAACAALLRPSGNHRLAVSEGPWLRCDPGHPWPQVFDVSVMATLSASASPVRHGLIASACTADSVILAIVSGDEAA